MTNCRNNLQDFGNLVSTIEIVELIQETARDKAVYEQIKKVTPHE